MKNVWGHELVFPEDVLYSPELLWVKVEPEKLRVGISDLAVKSVKKLLRVRLGAPVSKKLKKGDSMGMVETTKTVWEIKAPVSGVVVAVNPKISKGNPIPLMHDPYGEGWLVEMEKVNETENELKGLLRGDEAETKKWIQEQVEAIVPLM